VIWRQFHQHFTRAFFADILSPKIAKLCFGFEIFWCQNIGTKAARKMLMKLTIAEKFSLFYKV